MKVKNKEEILEEILSIIRKNPGIRPSELNRLLNIHHTWNLRKILIKRGLIRKEKDGSAVRYYMASQPQNGKMFLCSLLLLTMQPLLPILHLVQIYCSKSLISIRENLRWMFLGKGLHLA